FMGAGKTTHGKDGALRLGREFLDLDRAIEERAGMTIPELFEERGESGFRELERHAVRVALTSSEPAVVALGGGALGSPETRGLVASAFTVLMDIDVDEAWARARRSKRPLARDEGGFRSLYAERESVYREMADAVADDTTGIVLAAGGVRYERGGLDRLRGLVPGGGEGAPLPPTPPVGGHRAPAPQAPRPP